jgi:hypothetical protein
VRIFPLSLFNSPRELLGPGVIAREGIVIIQRRRRPTVRSCLDGEKWGFVTVTEVTTECRVKPYTPRRGERVVAEPPRA